MKKIVNLFFVAAMMFSIVFIGDAISSNGNLSVQAQQQTTVKRRKKGIIRRSYAGGKWVTKKVWVGTKWTGKKTYKTGRKVVSRSKKIIY
jgi:hypothetical protein